MPLKAELAFFGFLFCLAFFLTDLVQIEIGSKTGERAGSSGGITSRRRSSVRVAFTMGASHDDDAVSTGAKPGEAS